MGTRDARRTQLAALIIGDVMTLPDERARAVRYAREFLRDLLDAKKTPRVPKSVRMRAYQLLRHYPSDYEMDRAAENCPTIFKKSED